MVFYYEANEHFAVDILEYRSDYSYRWNHSDFIRANVQAGEA
jgi:hypothetical protein